MERSKLGEFNWIDLSARDFEGQSAFYESLFGWDHTDIYRDDMPYRMFNKDGHTVGGMSQLSPDMIAHGQPSAWNNYVAVDDIDATAAKAAELGGTVVMPPMEVTDFGRMAAIQDPTGAYLFFWKPLRPDETIEYMRPGTLSWTDLSTRDPERAAEFYARLLGWEIRALDAGPMPYRQVIVEGQGEGGIMPMAEMVPPEVPAFWMPYFGSADVAADAARARELGGTMVAEPTEVTGMLIFAVVADPVGATFALLQPLQAAQT